MEVDIPDDVLCPSVAVDSACRMGTAGLIWGSCTGPYDANKLGMFAAIFSSTRCGLQKYRRRNDWVNVLTAGIVAAALVGHRNWKQVAGATVVLVLVLCEPGDVWNTTAGGKFQCFMSGTVNVAAFIIVHCQALNPMVGRFKRSKGNPMKLY
ncbi:hypothetical protein HAX54_005833 [Datura stramonium]|uniref:Uncharacterized protein n=1 Tax=Datura stramonium TaxID=4076 RepID=A0ABS8TB21_DATST|nr:hypothetical protein [Datura stramonium]